MGEEDLGGDKGGKLWSEYPERKKFIFPQKKMFEFPFLSSLPLSIFPSLPPFLLSFF